MHWEMHLETCTYLKIQMAIERSKRYIRIRKNIQEKPNTNNHGESNKKTNGICRTKG